MYICRTFMSVYEFTDLVFWHYPAVSECNAVDVLDSSTYRQDCEDQEYRG